MYFILCPLSYKITAHTKPFFQKTTSKFSLNRNFAYICGNYFSNDKFDEKI
jgi:hypothetical protein